MSNTARAVVQARSLVDARVRRMVATLEARSPGILERLRHDAVEEMRLWDDIDVVALESSPPTDCSIAGVYLPNAHPPRIGIWSQMTKARAMFTALHEVGHHLQQTDELLIDELDAQPDEGAYLEERTSDAFAAHILLPRELIERALGAGTPTADRIAALWRESGVSRAAVCVAAAQQLEAPGHVILLDGDVVQFSASFGEPPLRRGSNQSASSIVQVRGRSTRSLVTSDEARFVYRDGIVGTPLYAQAADIGGYTVVVAVVHQAPWRAISLPIVSHAVVGAWQTCGRCDHVFQVWGGRCATCRAGFCPECGKCDCESRVTELTCENCFLKKPAHLFAGKLCSECAG
jgi:hypothetical protein